MQIGFFAVDSGRSNDEAKSFRRLDGLHRLTKLPASLLVVDLAAHAHSLQTWHQHEVAPGIEM